MQDDRFAIVNIDEFNVDECINDTCKGACDTFLRIDDCPIQVSNAVITSAGCHRQIDTSFNYRATVNVNKIACTFPVQINGEGATCAKRQVACDLDRLNCSPDAR